MGEIISNLSGIFIGEVKSYNIITRELEVYLPKLMPAIPENRENITVSTSLGRPINTNYNSFITISSSITAKALDIDEPLPDIGSKVGIIFLEEKAELCFWYKININFDYTVIPQEKYPSLFRLQIGDKILDIRQDDFLKISFDDEKDITLVEDKKIKNLEVLSNTHLEKRISKLENILGKESGIKKESNNFGEIVEKETFGSGLLSDIEKFKEQLSQLEDLKKQIFELEQEIASLKENKNT